MTHEERFRATDAMWDTYLKLGGSLAPELDPESPFFDEEDWRTLFADGRPSVHCVRRSGV